MSQYRKGYNNESYLGIHRLSRERQWPHGSSTPLGTLAGGVIPVHFFVSSFFSRLACERAPLAASVRTTSCDIVQYEMCFLPLVDVVFQLFFLCVFDMSRITLVFRR